MYSKNNLAFEAISFQSGAFGKALEEVFQKVVDLDFDYLAVKRARLVDKAADVVKQCTNMSVLVHFPENDENEFYALVDQININHIFGTISYSDSAKSYEGFAYTADNIKEVIKNFKSQDMKASVDISTGTVSGAFAAHQQNIVMSLHHMKKYGLTVRQITALFLHEVGHLFTYFEYVGRMRTTNLALEALAMANRAGPTNREYYYRITADGFDLDKKTMQELSKSADYTSAATFVLTECFRKHDSSMGIMAYDQTSTEYAADVFATRQGYGRELVTALADLGPTGNNSLMAAIIANVKEMLIISSITVASVAYITTSISLPVVLTGLALAILTKTFFYLSAERAYVYDDEKTRFSRIKEQLIAYLKTKPEDKETVLKAIEDIEAIQKTINETKDAMPFIVRVKEAVFKSKRELRTFVNLQRDLEKIGHNDLFKSAAKLDASL